MVDYYTLGYKVLRKRVNTGTLLDLILGILTLIFAFSSITLQFYSDKYSNFIYQNFLFATFMFILHIILFFISLYSSLNFFNAFLLHDSFEIKCIQILRSIEVNELHKIEKFYGLILSQGYRLVYMDSNYLIYINSSYLKNPLNLFLCYEKIIKITPELIDSWFSKE